jgi:hypothetical protein
MLKLKLVMLLLMDDETESVNTAATELLACNVVPFWFQVKVM